MRVSFLFALFSLAIDSSRKWLNRMIQTETPSVRYVRRLRTQPAKFTNGHEESRRTTMGRLEDPNFRYIPKAESEKPGYLEKRMKVYRELVRAESERLHPEPQKAGDGRGADQKVLGKPDNGLQGHKLSVVRGKA
jgi:hypothetical protein